MNVTALIENQRARPGSGLSAEHGLSLHIEHEGRSLLFDTGASGEFAANATRLGIDLSAVDAAVLSHHHYDHGGGLSAFFAKNDQAKVYLRPPPQGRPSFRALAIMNRYIGLPEGLIEAAKDRFVFVEGDSELFPGLFVIGQIRKRHAVPYGNRYLYLEKDGRRANDPFDHELMLVARLEAGIVVFTACSHSGIRNMVETAMDRFPGERIVAVIGGFHLIGLPFFDSLPRARTRVRKVGEALKALPVERYWTGHCTGSKAYGILKEILGPRLQAVNTGTVLAL